MMYLSSTVSYRRSVPFERDVWLNSSHHTIARSASRVSGPSSCSPSGLMRSRIATRRRASAFCFVRPMRSICRVRPSTSR